ncbi:hypothetical protein PFISCL1PPCAC_29156, partial [Pristionchus fissidentatus]
FWQRIVLKETSFSLKLLESSFQEVLQYIPAVSVYHYTKACRIALSKKIPVEQTRTLERYDLFMVDEFVSFVASSHNMLGLPYGVRTAKLSTGETLSFATVIRTHSTMDMIRSFIEYKKQHPTNNGKGKQHFSISTMIRMLNHMPATKRHNLSCVDAFKAAAYEAFEAILKIIQRLRELQLIDNEAVKKWTLAFLEIKLYLKHDYNLHLKKDSYIADHDMLYALSDPHNPLFSATFDHKRNLQCPRR